MILIFKFIATTFMVVFLFNANIACADNQYSGVSDETKDINSYFDGKSLESITPPPVNYFKNLSSISLEESSKLVSGNTLYSWNKNSCADRNRSDPCLSVALLEPSKGNINNAIKLFREDKEIFLKNWGSYPMHNAIYTGLHIGIEGIPTSPEAYSRNFNFNNLVQTNSQRNIIRINFPDGIIDIYIQKGLNEALVTEAKKANYKVVDRRNEISPAQFVLGSTVIAVAKGAIAAAAASSSGNLSSVNNKKGDIFECSFRCATDGLMFDETDAIQKLIQAKSESEAIDKLKKEAKLECGSRFGDSVSFHANKKMSEWKLKCKSMK